MGGQGGWKVRAYNVGAAFDIYIYLVYTKTVDSVFHAL